MNLRTRIIACLCIISILISLIIFSGSLTDLNHDPEYTAFSSGVATNRGVYYTENWNGYGYIYLLDNDGKVLDLFASSTVGEKRILDIYVYNGDLYVLLSTNYTYEDEEFTLHKIVRLDNKMNPVALVENIIIESDETVTGFSCDESSFYLTAVERNGNELNVYDIPRDEMINLDSDEAADGSDKDKDEQKRSDDYQIPASIVYREASPGKFFVQAEYADSVLNIRTDSDAPSGTFRADSRVKSAVDNIHFDLGDNIKLYSRYLLYWIGGILIWFILMFLFIYAIRNRNRVVYVLILGELIFLIALAASFFFVRYQYSYAGTREYSRFAVLALNGEMDMLGDLDRVEFDSGNYFSSEDYRRLQNSLSRFVQRSGNSSVFSDVFIMRLKDKAIMTGVSGRNREDASWEYGGAMTELNDSLKSSQPYAYENLTVDGNKYMAVGVLDDDKVIHNYALVGIISRTDPNLGFWGNARGVIILFIVVFILGSVLMFIAMYLQSIDLKRLEEEMRDVALGNTSIDIPSTPARDMQSMWSSLSEIVKRITETNYERYRIFEAYFRFAPKNIETIMEKDSIFDVNNGDIVHTSGTLMLISTDSKGFGTKRIKSLNNIIDYMDRYADNRDGILVSQDSSLSMMQFLFLEDSKNTSEIATQFLQKNFSDNGSDFVSVFIYKTSFMYGVVGIKEQSLTFLTSKDSHIVEEYSRWFESMRIPLVVMEEVRERERIASTRFIGYIIPDPETGDKINLYEVLDACPARDRQLKLVNKEKFEGTLELFYSRDFYLARNRFSEILKDCPEDEITRWYLFECERYLNEAVDEKNFGELRKRD
ncbi:MAG: hypothetical protein J6O71_01710 [Lachnospiraceae bacterium]|nr:hypothetical protein [Lachnospiraceae bacterium]